MTEYILVSLAALAATVINTIAGGGGLLTFPALALILPPVIADATSGFALLPGYFTAIVRMLGLAIPGRPDPHSDRPARVAGAAGHLGAV